MKTTTQNHTQNNVPQRHRILDSRLNVTLFKIKKSLQMSLRLLGHGCYVSLKGERKEDLTQTKPKLCEGNKEDLGEAGTADSSDRVTN